VAWRFLPRRIPGLVVFLGMVLFGPCLIGLACFLLLTPQFYRAPMFHEWVGLDDKLRLWAAVPPIADGKGDYAFADSNLNVLVVVSTGDAQYDGPVLPLGNSERARLLPGGPHEVRIERGRDLLIVVCADGRRAVFGIPAGEAARIWGAIRDHCQGCNCNLRQVVLESYRGADRERLGAFLEGGCD
jgi:hypothetical protein